MREKILLVEDELAFAEKIKLMLEYADYQVFHCKNGKVAIEQIKQIQPDLIICDVVMPEVDGYEFCEVFRTLGYLNTPFLFMSSNSASIDIRKGINLGADDYIVKPFSINDLLKGIKAKLAKKQQIDLLLAKVREDYLQEIESKNNIIDSIEKNYKEVIQPSLTILKVSTSLLDLESMDGRNKMIMQSVTALLEEIDKGIGKNVESLNNLSKSASLW